jgi:hypothetical protein
VAQEEPGAGLEPVAELPLVHVLDGLRGAHLGAGKRIFCVRSENIGAMLWVEDQPKDVAAQPREEPREERRKRALHAVSAIEDDQGAWGDGEVAPEVHAVAKVVETVARPALRLVKPEDMN